MDMELLWITSTYGLTKQFSYKIEQGNHTYRENQVLPLDKLPELLQIQTNVFTQRL